MMISFKNRLLLILTTLVVVSFALVGYILTSHLSESLNSKKHEQMKSKAVQVLDVLYNKKIKEQNIEDIFGMTDEQMLIKKYNEPIYQSDNIDLNVLNNRIKAWTNDTTSHHFYHYFPQYKQVIFIEQRGPYVVYLLDDRFNEIEEFNGKVWLSVGLSLLVLIPILYIIVRYVEHSYVRPISEVTYVAKLLGDGYYKARVPESSVTETRELYVNMNNLARTLESLHNEQKVQRNRLETTLQNIPSGIIMIDVKGQIAIANNTYNRLFNGGYQLEGHYNDMIQDQQLKRLVKEALVTEKSVDELLKIEMGISYKYFDTAVVPVLSRTKKKLEGVVIVMHDVTQLKKLEQMRKDFVANVSHELKTPITSIKGFSETLLDGAKEDEATLTMFLEIILKESNRLQVLISELLELSKIERTNKLEVEETDFTQKVLTSLEVVNPLALTKNIEIVTTIEDDVFIFGEASKLKQVIINLLSNAINYSSNDSIVEVKLYRENKEGILEVKDHGIGIPFEEQNRIFERFYRVDKARSRDSGGTGLGLSIVKHIVDAFDGVIEVESAPDVGSTFRVKFPLVR